MTNNVLLQISLDHGTIHAVRNIENGQCKGVYVDMSNRKLYWTERFNRMIYSAYLNGTEETELLDLGNMWFYWLSIQ